TIRLGEREELSAQQQSLRFRDYMMELTLLTEVTGRSRKELSESLKEAAKDFDIRVAQLGMSAEQREKFRKGIETVRTSMTALGPDIQKLMNEAIGQQITYGNIGVSTLGRVLSYMDQESRIAIENLMGRISEGGDGAGQALAEL